MQTPTRIIEDKEYYGLRALELEQHGFFRVLALDAMVFNPPTEDNDNPRSVYSEHVHMQVLNVKEPSLYIAKDGVSRVPIVLLPKYDEYDYDDLQSIHPVKNAWAYIVAPHGWKHATDDMEDAMYVFPDDDKKTIWL